MFLLSAQFVLNILVACLDHFLIGEELLDFGGFLTVEFVLQALVSDFLLSFQRSLELFILSVRSLLFFRQVVPLHIKLLSRLIEQANLNLQKLRLNFGEFDGFPQLGRLRQGILVVLHGKEILLNLRQFFLQLCLLLLLPLLEVGHEHDFLVMARLALLIVALLGELLDGVGFVRGLRLVKVIVEVAHVAFQGDLLLSVVLCCQGELLSLVSHILIEVSFLLLELLSLFLDNLELRVEDELLALDLERLLLELIECPVEVALHLRILILEQADVLVAGLVVVVQTTDTRLLLVLQNLLFQNLQLELHKVDLLLQVDNVLVLRVNVWIITQLARCLLFLLLAAEIHGHSRLIALVAAKGATTSEIRSAFQITASR